MNLRWGASLRARRESEKDIEALHSVTGAGY